MQSLPEVLARVVCEAKLSQLASSKLFRMQIFEETATEVFLEAWSPGLLVFIGVCFFFLF